LTRQIQWPRIVTEGIAIVASILLAFGIQAWWETRQDRSLELDTLERLDTQLSAIDSVLSDYQTRQLDAVEACEVLLSLVGPSGSSDLAADSIATLIAKIRVPYTVAPPTGTMTALESSGQLATLSNQQLLSDLANWRALLQDHQEDEARLGEMIASNLDPFLLTHASLVEIGMQHPFPHLAGSVPGAFPVDIRELLRSRIFENLVEDRRRLGANAVSNYEILRGRLADLQSTIRRELDR